MPRTSPSLVILIAPCAAFAALALLAASCTSSGTSAELAGPDTAMMMPMTRPLSDDGIFFVESGDPKYPRVRYLDGQVSQNQSCAIRLDNKLNRKIPPIYVNGQPIGFC